ncbi:hypothetical protein GCM10023097_01860 [Streptomyces collinus]
MDQIVPLQQQPHAPALEPAVHDLLQRRGEPGVQRGEYGGVGAGHRAIVTRECERGARGLTGALGPDTLTPVADASACERRDGPPLPNCTKIHSRSFV